MSWSSKRGPELLGSHGWLASKYRRVLLTGARLVDPAEELDKTADLLVEEGKIKRIGKIDRTQLGDHHTLDLRGKIVTPGLADLHVHLREPGREDKETILSGTCAAVAGGFTAIACMPNTDPALDNVGVIRWVYDMAAGSPVSVHPVAAVTQGRKGKMISEIEDLFHSGVRAFSDDGDPVVSAEVMRRALEYSKMHDLVIMTHSEEPALAGDGVIREGEVSTRLGLSPWPSIAESAMVGRDLLLAEFTGGRLHVQHISSKESIELVRHAKAKGVRVTCEATPHHIALTDEACVNYDSNTKMNPPLGTKEDREAVIEGLRDGTIDAIATDHAPHTPEDKLCEFGIAANGVVGLETAIGIVAKELVETKALDWSGVVERMAHAPRRVLKLPQVTIKKGAVAELSMIDPEAQWTVEPEKFLSKGRNTPFAGWTLPARPVGIINRRWVLVSPDARTLWE